MARETSIISGAFDGETAYRATLTSKGSNDIMLPKFGKMKAPLSARTL